MQSRQLVQDWNVRFKAFAVHELSSTVEQSAMYAKQAACARLECEI